MMKKEEKKKYRSISRTGFSLVGQVLIFSLLATIITGVLSFAILKNNAKKTVEVKKQELAADITKDIVKTIKGYPAYEWLITYWFEHAERMDVEYTVTDFTVNKARELSKRNPGLVIDYVTTEEVKALPEEDRKLYAEVMFSQTVDLLNLLKVNYDPAYLSLLVANPEYTRLVFLVSGASPNQKRGRNMDEAFVVGVSVNATENQKEGLKNAASGGGGLSQYDSFVDAYGYVQDIMGGWHVMVDVAYEMSGLTNEANDQVIVGMIRFILLQSILAIGLFFLTYFYAVRHIDRLQKNVWRYQQDKKSDHVLEDLKKIKVKNELGSLAANVSEMVASIDRYVAEIQDITKEKERIAAELNVAAKIQTDMLPSVFPAFPERNEFELYATMDPAREVGGDFYDFFLVDEDHICLVIADVSGKSVPAALFMVNSKTRIQTQALSGKSPAEILSAVNDQICVENESGYFVTVWLGIVDLKTGKGVASNAGHEHPVIRRGNGEYEAVIYKHSPAVGMMEGIRFVEHEFEMKPGDRIFVYTDGVPEATNSSDELFGLERMLESLNNHNDADLQELLPALKADIDAFVGEAVQFDDITMLGFDYHGPAEGKK